MKAYRLKGKAKSKTEVNIARLLQLSETAVLQNAELKALQTVEPPPIDKPQRTEGTVTSRKRSREPPKPTEYELKSRTPGPRGDKNSLWKGRREDSGHFAVAYLDGNEVRLSLVDHWYKFSRVLEPTKSGEGEEAQEKGPMNREEKLAEAFGMKQQEERGKRERKKGKEEDEEEDAMGEEMDFSPEFEDDDEAVDDEPADLPQSQPDRPHKLTKSGKQLEKALNVEKFSPSSPSSSDSMGLDDSSDDNAEPAKAPLSREAFINEMIRLGKVTKRMLEESLQAKFNLKDQSTQQQLSGFVKKLTDEMREGGEVYYVLKDEYKRLMPSHAARVQFMTGQK